ncbi:MAG: DUF4058 family protein [Pirellulales bacterium]|nr:DUF4058 family protein [Pirellulales bacterium]
MALCVARIRAGRRRRVAPHPGVHDRRHEAQTRRPLARPSPRRPGTCPGPQARRFFARQGPRGSRHCRHAALLRFPGRIGTRGPPKTRVCPYGLRCHVEGPPARAEGRLAALPLPRTVHAASGAVSPVYAWSIREPLPAIPVPLKASDPDVPLDLQAAFITVYDRPRYQLSLNDEEDLKPPLADDDVQWCCRRLGSDS